MANKKRIGPPKYPDIESWISDQPKQQQSDLLAALTSIRKLHRESRSTDLTWWYDVGVQVDKFFSEGRNYGAKVNELLAKDLTVVEAEVKGLSNLFWKARNVARNLSKAEARAWSKKRNERGDPLSAYHVLKLVSVQDKVKRDQLLDDCLQQCWSVARLEKEVQNSFGYLRSGGRRKTNPRPAPTPAIALREIQLNSAAWLENHKLWQRAMQVSLWRFSTQKMKKLSVELTGAKESLTAVQNALKEELADLKRLTERVETQLNREE